VPQGNVPAAANTTSRHQKRRVFSERSIRACSENSVVEGLGPCRFASNELHFAGQRESGRAPRITSDRSCPDAGALK